VEGPAWEYLLFTEVLHNGINNLRGKRFDHTIGHARFARVITSASEAESHYYFRMLELEQVCKSLTLFLTPECQRWMFGEQGEPGDRDRILHVGSRFVETYGDILNWSADMRGTSVPAAYKALYAASAQLATGPLEQVENFVGDFYQAARGKETTELNLVIKFDSAEMDAELAKLGMVSAKRD
jgi:hypothetical protein